MPVVSEIMSAEVVVLDVRQTVDQAIEKLVTNGFSAAPVVQDGVMVGIVSELELFDVLFDTELRSVSVAEVMRTNVISIEESEALEQVAYLFALHKIRRLPVVRAGKPVGIVSRRDLLRFSLTYGRALHDSLAELMPFGEEEHSFANASEVVAELS